MGLFDQDDINFEVEPEKEPAVSGTEDNSEVGQSAASNEVEAPEVDGQANPAPETEGQAEQVNNQPQKLAGIYNNEMQLDKGCQSIAEYLGENVDISNMSIQDKEQYYLDARRRMSQGNKPVANVKPQSPIQTQPENRNGDLTELANLLTQTLQANRAPQIEPPKPKGFFDMPKEEFAEMLYSDPQTFLQNLLHGEGEKLGQDLRGYLEPLSQARKDYEERSKWEKTFHTVRGKHDDFDSLTEEMGQVYEADPGLKELGERGLEMAYQLAKNQKETNLLRQKTLEYLERQSLADTQRIENIKQGASIPGSSNNRQSANTNQTEKDMLRQMFGLGGNQKRGVFDDF